MTRDEFDALPVIMDQFPLTFKTGIQQWTYFEVHCNDCKRVVMRDQTRGTICRETTWGDPYRGTRSFTQYNLVAHALCPYCDKVTTAVYQLGEDMVVTEIKDNKRFSFRMHKLTIWERIVRFLKGV